MASKSSKALIGFAVLGVLVAAGWWWKTSGSSPVSAKPAQQGPATQGPSAVTVRVAQATQGDLREDVNAIGTLLANESVMIRPELDGRIREIHFAEGQTVAQGAKLVSLDAMEVEAQLKATDADVSLNQSRLRRAEELKQKNFISGQALDDARENLNQSLARQAEIRARLDKLLLRAPFEGVVGVRQVSPGAYVSKGQDIARLEGIGTLKLDFRVPEVYLSRIRPGQDVIVNVDAYPGEQFRGEIYAVEPSVDEQTRTVLLRAKVPNPGVRLKPGQFARVSLTLGTRENAVIVPEQAIVPRGQDFYVFRVVDGKARLTRVELGLRRPGQAQIVSGLDAGETVVTDGQQRLRDGGMVKVVEAPGSGAPRQTAQQPGKS